MENNSGLFIERCKVDHELVTKLILSQDIQDTLTKEGFELTDRFYTQLEKNISKIREYITDQIHVLEIKDQSMNSHGAVSESGNGHHW